MPTGNFDETSAPASLPPGESVAFQLPADYYSTPPVAVLPRWMPYGCGAVSLFALLMIFAGGAFLSGGGFTVLLNYVLVSTSAEIKTMYASDVTADEKRDFEQEMKTLRANLDSGKVSPAGVQELLKKILAIGADRKASKEEIVELTNLARKANARR